MRLGLAGYYIMTQKKADNRSIIFVDMAIAPANPGEFCLFLGRFLHFNIKPKSWWVEALKSC